MLRDSYTGISLPIGTRLLKIGKIVPRALSLPMGARLLKIGKMVPGPYLLTYGR